MPNRVQTVAAIVGTSFSALVGRLSAYLSTRKDVASIRLDIARGRAAAGAIKNDKRRSDPKQPNQVRHPPIARRSSAERVPPHKQLSDAELIDGGATFELLLSQFESDVDTLDPQVEAEGRKLRKTFRKLGLTGAAAVCGVLAATLTGGWSLLAAAAPLGVAFLEMQDYVRDRQLLTALQKRLAALRTEATFTSVQLETIRAELDARTHD